MAQSLARSISLRLVLVLGWLAISATALQAEGWVYPVTATDPDYAWADASYAFDAIASSYGRNTPGVQGYGGFLELDLGRTVYTDRVLVTSDFGYGIVDAVDIDGKVAGSWVDLYEGAIDDATPSVVAFAPQDISAFRFRYHYVVGGWEFWLYDFACYELVEPVLPPQVATEAATSIWGDSAVVHAQIISAGGSPAQVRFEYGPTDAYGTVTPWSGSLSSGMTVGRLLGAGDGLSPGTWHVRAQATNASGVIISGDDSVFTTSMTIGTRWLSPNGHDASAWTEQDQALDDEPSSAARCQHQLGADLWSPWLTLTNPTVPADGVRVIADREPAIDAIQVQVFRDGVWLDLYQGAFATGAQQQFDFSAGQVSGTRVRLHVLDYLYGLYWNVDQVQVHAVANQAPSFSTGANQTVLEDAGAQSVASWATAISPGPAGESAQTVTFTVTNDANALFSVQPAVSANGALTFTSAPNANGVAHVTVIAHDSGGTANGGMDTSSAQSFLITVTPVNDAPSFLAGADRSVAADAGAQTVSGWATAISPGPMDEAGQALEFQVSADHPELFSAQSAISAAGTLTFTPAAAGLATVTVKLHDDGLTANGGIDLSAAQTFHLTITAAGGGGGDGGGTPPVITNVIATVTGGLSGDGQDTIDDEVVYFSKNSSVSLSVTATISPGSIQSITLTMSDGPDIDCTGGSATYLPNGDGRTEIIATVVAINDGITAVAVSSPIAIEHFTAPPTVSFYIAPQYLDDPTQRPPMRASLTNDQDLVLLNGTDETQNRLFRSLRHLNVFALSDFTATATINSQVGLSKSIAAQASVGGASSVHPHVTPTWSPDGLGDVVSITGFSALAQSLVYNDATFAVQSYVGRYTLHLSLQDRCGNQMDADQFKLWVDTTPPVAHVATIPHQFLAHATFQIAANDATELAPARFIATTPDAMDVFQDEAIEDNRLAKLVRTPDSIPAAAPSTPAIAAWALKHPVLQSDAQSTGIALQTPWIQGSCFVHLVDACGNAGDTTLTPQFIQLSAPVPNPDDGDFRSDEPGTVPLPSTQMPHEQPFVGDRMRWDIGYASIGDPYATVQFHDGALQLNSVDAVWRNGVAPIQVFLNGVLITPLPVAPPTDAYITSTPRITDDSNLRYTNTLDLSGQDFGPRVISIPPSWHQGSVDVDVSVHKVGLASPFYSPVSRPSKLTLPYVTLSGGVAVTHGPAPAYAPGVVKYPNDPFFTTPFDFGNELDHNEVIDQGSDIQASLADAGPAWNDATLDSMLPQQQGSAMHAGDTDTRKFTFPIDRAQAQPGFQRVSYRRNGQDSIPLNDHWTTLQADFWVESQLFGPPNFFGFYRYYHNYSRGWDWASSSNYQHATGFRWANFAKIENDVISTGRVTLRIDAGFLSPTVRLSDFNHLTQYAWFMSQGIDQAFNAVGLAQNPGFIPPDDKISILEQRLVLADQNGSLNQVLEMDLNVGSQVPADVYDVDVNFGAVKAYSDELSQLTAGANGAHRMKQALAVYSLKFKQFDQSGGVTDLTDNKLPFSTPNPKVTLSSSSFSIGSQGQTSVDGYINLAGSLTSSVCDVTEGASINQVDVFVDQNKTPVGTISVNVTKGSGAEPRKYPYSGAFNGTVAANLKPGPHTIKVRATDPVIGKVGYAEVSLEVRAQGGNSDPAPGSGFASYSQPIAMQVDLSQLTTVASLDSGKTADAFVASLVSTDDVGGSVTLGKVGSSPLVLGASGSDVRITVTDTAALDAALAGTSDTFTATVEAWTFMSQPRTLTFRRVAAGQKVFAVDSYELILNAASGFDAPVTVQLRRGQGSWITDTLTKVGSELRNAAGDFVIQPSAAFFAEGSSGAQALTAQVTNASLGISNVAVDVQEGTAGSGTFASANVSTSGNDNPQFYATSTAAIQNDATDTLNPLAIQIDGPEEIVGSSTFRIQTVSGDRKVVKKDGSYFLATEDGGNRELTYLLAPQETPKAIGGAPGDDKDDDGSHDNPITFIGGFVVGFAGGAGDLVCSTGKLIFNIFHLGGNLLLSNLPGSVGQRAAERAQSSIDTAYTATTSVVQTLATIAQALAARKEEVEIALITGDSKKLGDLGTEYAAMMEMSSEIFIQLSNAFLDLNSYDQGKIMGHAIFEIASFAIPAAKLGRLEAIGKAAGMRTMIKGIQEANWYKKLTGASKTKLDEALGKCTAFADRLAGPIGQKMCFVAGTKVYTDHGLQPIETIRAGDHVLSRDPRSGTQRYQPVTATFVTHPTSLYHVHLRSGHARTHGSAVVALATVAAGDEGSEPPGASTSSELVCTGAHPFWVAEAGAFVPAANLRQGEHLLLAGGESAEVVSLDHEDAPEGSAFTTYNFEVEGFHTYFVGTDGVWVHNSGRECERIFTLYERLRTRDNLAPLDAMKALRAKLPGASQEAMSNAWGAAYKDLGGSVTLKGIKFLEDSPNPLRGTWETPKGLRYGPERAGTQFDNRIEHVLDHTKDNPAKGVQGVFADAKEHILDLLDEAWVLVQSSPGRVASFTQTDGATRFVIDMQRDIGLQGGIRGAQNGTPLCRYIRIVVDDYDSVKHTGSVRTAFPQVTFNPQE